MLICNSLPGMQKLVLTYPEGEQVWDILINSQVQFYKKEPLEINAKLWTDLDVPY